MKNKKIFRSTIFRLSVQAFTLRNNLKVIQLTAVFFELLGQETLDMGVLTYLMGSPNCKDLKKFM